MNNILLSFLYKLYNKNSNKIKNFKEKKYDVEYEFKIIVFFHGSS